MKVTKQDLVNLVGSKRRLNLDAVASEINNVLDLYDINTPLRLQHFLAQLAHESDGFNTNQEYATGNDYDTRTDLGNTPERDGDGAKYKGRGYIQLTGASNYKAYSKFKGIDFVSNPDLVATKYAADVSGWFWKKNKLNELADKDDANGITKKINGGFNGLEKRLKYLAKAKIFLKNVATSTGGKTAALVGLSLLLYLSFKK